MTEDDPVLDDQLQLIKRLEEQLVLGRTWAIRATRELHLTMGREIREAEQRARRAERRATSAEKRAVHAERLLARARDRARRAESEVATIRGSTTWKAGRVVVAVPARLKRWRST